MPTGRLLLTIITLALMGLAQAFILAERMDLGITHENERLLLRKADYDLPLTSLTGIIDDACTNRSSQLDNTTRR